MANDCYKCRYRGEVPGSVHSTCSFFRGELKSKLTLLGLFKQLPTITDDETGKDILAFDRHGVESGWCNYPVNFDPVWVTCNLPLGIGVGDKVCYKEKENGIVKSIDGDNAYVVYNCGNDWKNYMNYTAAQTKISDLSLGWQNEES